MFLKPFYAKKPYLKIRIKLPYSTQSTSQLGRLICKISWPALIPTGHGQSGQCVEPPLFSQDNTAWPNFELSDFVSLIFLWQFVAMTLSIISSSCILSLVVDIAKINQLWNQWLCEWHNRLQSGILFRLLIVSLV